MMLFPLIEEMRSFIYGADFDLFYLLNICSLRVHKERLLQVPWEAEVAEVVSVVVDEECVDDETCILMGQH
jgi:hypothetical protein